MRSLCSWPERCSYTPLRQIGFDSLIEVTFHAFFYSEWVALVDIERCNIQGLSKLWWQSCNIQAIRAKILKNQCFVSLEWIFMDNTSMLKRWRSQVAMSVLLVVVTVSNESYWQFITQRYICTYTGIESVQRHDVREIWFALLVIFVLHFFRCCMRHVGIERVT